MFQHYLMFGGNCEEALAVYEKAFGGKVNGLMRYGDMPDADEKTKHLIMHSRFELNGGNIMCADYPHAPKMGDNMWVIPPLNTVEDVEKAWEVLKIGGKVCEELNEPFYAEIYGTLCDKFGINWMLMIDKPMPK